LMVGYPGAGKTTTSQIIHDLTEAVHIWADYERRAMFGDPKHTHSESQELYGHLNKSTELLLAEGQSVIFDTGFNHRKDRDKLRAIADAHKADTKLIWVQVSKDIAKGRAVSDEHADDNSYTLNMTHHEFESTSSKLEPPEADEQPIILDGIKITPEYVAKALKLPKPHKTASKAAPKAKA
jgi:predicted kinase